MWLVGLFLFFVTLGILVFVHEMGHFLAAKSVGVTVDEFAFGFGPKLVTLLRRGGTDYTIRALPLGGFVSMAGMQPEDVAVPNGLMSKPAWARAWVFLAGPLMNVILAFLVLCSMGMVTGVPEEQSTQVFQVVPGSEAERIGLRTGDFILAIDGVPMKNGPQIIEVIKSHPGRQIVVTWKHGSETRTVSATPRPEAEVPGKPKIVGRLGFQPGVTYKRLPFRQSVVAGVKIVGNIFISLRDITQHGKLKDAVGGPVSMLRITQMNAKVDPANQYGMVGQLSLSLAIFNLLPIPVLDGGHLFILMIEVLRRRRLGPEAHRVATAMGLVVIGVLFVFLMYSDVSKWVTGRMLQ
jgi:regulator of sigma E protease